MTDIGLLLPEGKVGNYTPSESVELAQYAEEHGFHSVWRGESYSTNAFMNLTATARHTDQILLGTAITNIFSRPPTLIGMSIATLDALSDERTLVGLGVSTDTIIEDWYDVEFERPLRRTREVIEILRELFRANEIDYDGEIFDIGPYPSGFSLDRESVPIYNAALGETNCKLTGEYADGWLPIFIPPEDMQRRYEGHVLEGAEAAGRDASEIAVEPIVITAIADDHSEAESKAREALAQVMSVGYNEVVAQFGFGQAADEAAKQWRRGDREASVDAISDEMVRELTLYGTPEECRSELLDYEDKTDADAVIVLPSFSSSQSEIEYVIESLEPATH